MVSPNNIRWLSRSPRVFIFHVSKFEWSPLWILPKFSVILPFGFSVTTDLPFCSPKNQVIPPKSSPPPPPLQAINNHRCLRLIGSSAYSSRQKSLKPPYTSLYLSNVDVIVKLRVHNNIAKGRGERRKKEGNFPKCFKVLSKIVSLLRLSASLQTLLKRACQ